MQHLHWVHTGVRVGCVTDQHSRKLAGKQQMQILRLTLRLAGGRRDWLRFAQVCSVRWVEELAKITIRANEVAGGDVFDFGVAQLTVTLWITQLLRLLLLLLLVLSML